MEPPVAAVPVAPRVAWSGPKRVLFRFFFIYFLLYVLPFPFDALPYQELTRLDKVTGWKIGEKTETFVSDRILKPWGKWNDEAVKLAGKKYFHTDITVGPNGSGDTTWNYVQLALFAAAALAGCLVWTLLDWWSRSYDRLDDGWRTLVRFKLAATMLGYGGFKVIKSQFAAPSLDGLIQPLGEMSPMGLCWTFMGFSTGYTILSGAAEMLGGLLLGFRRTTLAGALVTIVVMINVVAINFFYDVPVKLFSLHLLAMAVILVLPDGSRLCNFLLHRRPTVPRVPRPLFANPVLHWTGSILGALFILWTAWTILRSSWEGRNRYGDGAKPPPHYGTWNVEVFEVDGELVAEESEAERWTRVRIGRYSMGISHRGHLEERMWAAINPRPGGSSLALTRMEPPGPRATLKMEQPTPDEMVLDGTVDGRTLHVELSRASDDSFLMNRGFHWINEFPMNR